MKNKKVTNELNKASLYDVAFQIEADFKDKSKGLFLFLVYRKHINELPFSILNIIAHPRDFVIESSPSDISLAFMIDISLDGESRQSNESYSSAFEEIEKTGKQQNISWDNIKFPIGKYCDMKKSSYSSVCCLQVNHIKHVDIFDKGFSIRTENGIDLFGITHQMILEKIKSPYLQITFKKTKFLFEIIKNLSFYFLNDDNKYKFMLNVFKQNYIKKSWSAINDDNITDHEMQKILNGVNCVSNNSRNKFEILDIGQKKGHLLQL